MLANLKNFRRLATHVGTPQVRSSIINQAMRNMHILGSVPCDAPMASDQVVNVTLVDYNGNQTKIQGRVGQTLIEACSMNNVDVLDDESFGGGASYSVIRSDKFTEDLYGEGACSPLSHVVVANEWISQMDPPSPKELETLELVHEDDLTPTSRLGTEIVLHKGLNGLVVGVPDPVPLERYDVEEPEM